MTVLIQIPIETIQHRPDARHRSDEVLEALCESIDESGLLSPISVRLVGDIFEVVAGSHRLQACELLGHTQIACILVEADDLHAELAMIDENLCRAELSPSDRAKNTARRKAIYLELHPETKHGGDRRSDQVANLATRSFVDDTSAKAGQSERLVRRDAERGEKIVPEALNAIQGTRLDRGVYLDRLKRVEPAQQVATVRRDLDRPGQGGIVAQYARVETPAPQDNPGLYARFIRAADEIEAMSVSDLVEGAGRQRAVLGQRASGLADRMDAIMEGLDQ